MDKKKRPGNRSTTTNTKMRMCTTPGCTRKADHIGLCSHVVIQGKRQRCA
jgi:hypothetical protein